MDFNNALVSQVEVCHVQLVLPYQLSDCYKVIFWASHLASRKQKYWNPWIWRLQTHPNWEATVVTYSLHIISRQLQSAPFVQNCSH